MTRRGSYASCRTDDDLISHALGRLRRRDLRIWGAAPHWIENSGPDGTGRLVRWDDDRVEPLVAPTSPLGSALYGYGAPGWSPISDERAIALTTRPVGTVLVRRDGTTLATDELDAVAAGYVCRVAEDVAVVVDRGPGRGRTIVTGSPGGHWREVYVTKGLVSDLVAADDGARAAWIEWPVGTMPWDAGTLRVATVTSQGSWVVEVPDLGGTCAQASFVGADLVVDVEAGEWFHPHRTRGSEWERVPVPEADYRPDWCLGHTWAAGDGVSNLWCAARESRARQWIERAGIVTELRSGPTYVYDVCADASGHYALGSSTIERAALWHLPPGEDAWRQLGTTTSVHLWSGRPALRRSPDGVPFLWYWPDVNGSFVPTDRPGLVVMVHGGPTRYASYEFSWVIELICRSGLAVATVDHRGSTSYGRTHRVALDGHWGDYDVADAVSVLDAVVASGDVDPSRVFTRGTSAGALSALLVASTTAVAGVVVVSPVTDPHALFGSSDEFDCGYARQLTGGEDRALERSPQRALATMPSRALVIHGENDAIVPVAQTRAFVTALRESGRDVTYVELDGEGHSFRKPESGRRALDAEAAFYASFDQSSSESPSVHSG